jgi:hypothetical protein
LLSEGAAEEEEKEGATEATPQVAEQAAPEAPKAEDSSAVDSDETKD